VHPIILHGASSVKRAYLNLILVALVLFFVSTGIITSVYAEKPVVVTSTTVLASIVEDLAGDQVIVEYISLPSVCPAHYDVKPSDVEKLKYASLVLSHGIEPWIDKLISASGSRAQVFKDICKSWSTPSDLKNCYIQVADILEKYLGISINERLNKSLQIIDEVASWLKNYSRENGFEGVPVVVMKWQKSYISYLGFNVVASYGPPETVSLKEYSDVISNATKARAILVIDNIPSGVDLGIKIAKEIGAVEVAIHNFPKAAPEISNVTDMWIYNAKLLANALRAVNTTITTETLYNQVLKLSRDVNSLIMYLSISIVINIILAVALVIVIVKFKGVKK